ncbi:MAG: hypothetical protein NZ561_00500, partial [Phycisphaerae bacterium]|nr:hypothetical protein [Phycisphaerae bacterium]
MPAGRIKSCRGLLPVVLLAGLLLTVMACENHDSATADRLSPEQARGTAVVRGTVRFAGPPPPRRTLKSEPCHHGQQRTILDETVIVGPDGGLKNVFVYLEGGPKVDGRLLPPIVLDQVDCVYVPHAVGVVVGQTLKVRSSDDVYHNTHYTPRRNPANNFGLVRAGQEREVRFVAPEIFTARCDVHPWMSAQIGVFDNPFFAVSRDDGSFEIANLPAGTYTLVAHHELYGEQRQTLTLEADSSH